MRKDELDLLKTELKLLDDQKDVLQYSYGKCRKLGIKESYSIEELDGFEALTSRFARTSDILIQKIFRLLDIIELESPGSIIDIINRAEKRGLISSAAKFKEIRRLRNDIAHEYILSAIEDINLKAMELTPHLLDSIDRVKRYVKNSHVN